MPHTSLLQRKLREAATLFRVSGVLIIMDRITSIELGRRTMQPSLATDLVDQARKGNSEAAGMLYEQYYQSIYRYLYYWTGDSNAAEDLTGEVFLKMVKGLSTYQGLENTFKSWLYQIARNLAIDHYRQNVRRPQVPITDDIPTHHDNPETAAAFSIERATLRKALLKLNGEQRDVILLRFIEGLPIQEVCQMMKKSDNAVKGLQRRALENLRLLLLEMETKHG